MALRETFLGAVCIAVGTVLLATVPASAARILETKEYFPVYGDTLSEIDQSLSRSGPQVTGSNLRHPGATSVQFHGQLGYQKTDRGCSVGKTDIQLKLKTTLPRWYRPRRVDQRTSIVWQTLADDIARHEEKHSDIAISYLKRMEMALKNLRPEATCQQMEAKANAVMNRYLGEHERAQQEFDVMEGREIDRRLYRSLKRSLREAQRTD